MFKKSMAAVFSLAVTSARAGESAVADARLQTPEGYVAPTDPAVVEHLEWFRDQKFGLLMHFGLYSALGINPSWVLSDADAETARKGVAWATGDDLKRDYIGLYRSFNPVRINAGDWAKTVKDAGCRYLIFTAKHHDGFCLWDTKTTDYKTTNPECPFSRNPKADIVRHVFDAFRAEGLGISCYFSKSDWHHPDYWDNCGLGVKTTMNPTYDWKADAKRWARFREFTRRQLLELLTQYGKVDVLWLDGKQVRPKDGQDIGMEEIVAEARKTQPWLISADRMAGGSCEDFVTPQQAVPESPLAVPWESCVTLTAGEKGENWGYAFDDVTYKSVREIVHMLVDVVAKGGNLVVNIGPRGDGCLPRPAVERLEGVGTWLKANGEAIYATRLAAPYRTKEWAYTRSKDGKSVYAIRPRREGETPDRKLVVDCGFAARVKNVVHLATGRKIAARADEENNLVLSVPDDIEYNAFAEAFRLEMND